MHARKQRDASNRQNTPAVTPVSKNEMRLTRTRSLSARSLPELTQDVLVWIVVKGSASTLVVMLQTCKAWRTALGGQSDGLWKTLALRRFPYICRVLEHEATVPSFRTVYRQQLAAHACRRPPITPALDEYIFVAVIFAADDIFGEWSGVLGAADQDVPIEWSMPPGRFEIMHAEATQYRKTYRHGPYLRSLRCQITVTRRSDFATLIMYKPTTMPDEAHLEVDGERIFDNLDHDNISAVGVDFRSDNPPEPEQVFDGMWNFEISPQIFVGADPSEGQLGFGFYQYIPDHGTEPVDTAVLRQYLHLAPWQSVV